MSHIDKTSNEILAICRMHHYTKQNLIEEADCVDQYGEWMYLPLMAYSAEMLRDAAAALEA